VVFAEAMLFEFDCSKDLARCGSDGRADEGLIDLIVNRVAY
jgi:hypothetical protein